MDHRGYRRTQRAHRLDRPGSPRLSLSWLWTCTTSRDTTGQRIASSGLTQRWPQCKALFAGVTWVRATQLAAADPSGRSKRVECRALGSKREGKGS